MTVSKDLRFSHVFTAKAKKIADRRSHELSEPGKYHSKARYINDLIEADGKLHPDPKTTNNEQVR